MWFYSQTSGALTDPNGNELGRGYSGNGPAMNSPAAQNVLGHGPCPQGLYAIGQFYTDPTKGPIVAHLMPDAANTMFGRSGFMIHGDNPQMDHTASDGCIILAHDLRQAIASSGDKGLTVTS
jgi:hypothetical protein